MNTFRNIQLLCLLTLCCTGCSLERSWFQMNSNSPMPFFGFDFRLPRKTSSLEPVSHEQQLAENWNSETTIKTVSHQKKNFISESENLLSKLPKLENSEKTETLTFNGPKARFAP